MIKVLIKWFSPPENTSAEYFRVDIVYIFKFNIPVYLSNNWVKFLT